MKIIQSYILFHNLHYTLDKPNILTNNSMTFNGLGKYQQRGGSSLLLTYFYVSVSSGFYSSRLFLLFFFERNISPSFIIFKSLFCSLPSNSNSSSRSLVDFPCVFVVVIVTTIIIIVYHRRHVHPT